MEMKLSRSLFVTVLSVLAAFAANAAAASDSPRPRARLSLGASGFMPSQDLLREVYGRHLLGLQAGASFRFDGGASVFVGVRSVRADGQAKILDQAFDTEGNDVRLDLLSLRAGFGYEWMLGRFTLGVQTGMAWILGREAWPAADLEAETKSFGLLVATTAEAVVFGPLGIYVRLEAAQTELKNDLRLGGLNAEAGLSLRF
jgi:hypothetical protein